MRLLVLSDLHREWWDSGEWQPPANDPVTTIDLAVSEPDVVVLAGDIDEGSKGVKWANESFPGLPVIYVPGNHESYGGVINEVYEANDHLSEATRYFDEGGRVSFLPQGQLVIGGVRFLCATLWTDFCLRGEIVQDVMMTKARDEMNDYHCIKVSNRCLVGSRQTCDGVEEWERLLTPRDTLRIHQRDVAFLSEKLAEPFDGKTVVVTHMAPSERSRARQAVHCPPDSRPR